MTPMQQQHQLKIAKSRLNQANQPKKLKKTGHQMTMPRGSKMYFH